jgi:hypothetical protein
MNLMRFDDFDDILDLVLQRIADIPCLKRLFCASKELQVICKQKFTSMNRNLESKLREEIHFVLTPGSSPHFNEFPQAVLRLSFSREYFLHSKRTALHIAESICKIKTKLSLDFRELKVKTKFKNKKRVAFGVYSSVMTGKRSNSLNLLEFMTRDASLLFRSTADSSKVIRSKIRAWVRGVRMTLDSAIFDIDALIRRFLASSWPRSGSHAWTSTACET